MGPSSALNVTAATKLALRHRDSGKVIVTILCDGGGRYTSKLYNAEWLAQNGLSTAAAGCEGGSADIVRSFSETSAVADAAVP